MPKFCSECGAKAEGSGKFCSTCGTRFPVETNGNTMNMSSIASAMDTMNSTWNGNANQNHQNSNASAPSYQETVAAAQTLAPVAGSAAEKIRQFNSFKQETKQLPIHVGPNPMPPRHMHPRASSGSNWTPPEKSIPIVTAVEVPPAATGMEAQQVYERCIQTIQASKGGNNKEGVKEFKKNCKSYGQNQLSAQDFYQTLVLELGQVETIDFIPDLARLIPDEVLRKQLMEYNQLEKEKLTASGMIGTMGGKYGKNPYSRSKNRDSFASSASDETEMSSGDSTVEKKKGKLLTGRYNDHPRCDICQGAFDVSKRRHQCRNCGKFICSSCSPIYMLIPPGKQYENAKGYDPSIPQRVCLHCAPQLEPKQAELVQTYAQSNETNIHEAKGRIHVPFSNSLQKECRNAADIVGNFFRDDWGSAADRSIPVAFLEKAHGIAVMTIIKAGFMITGKIGTGLVVSKLPDGSWSAPSAIGTVGMGTGFEIGGEIVEVMIILGSQRAVKVFHTPQINIGAGLDLTVGPYGRSAAAAAAASTSGLNANYTYSQSKGFFAGVSLQGAIIATRNDLNRKFYGRDLSAAEILSGYVEQPTAAKPLYTAIDHALEGVAIHHEEHQRRAEAMGACRQCACPRFVTHTKQVWNKNCKICKHVH